MRFIVEPSTASKEGCNGAACADDEEYRPRSLAKELTYFEKVKQR